MAFFLSILFSQEELLLKNNNINIDEEDAIQVYDNSKKYILDTELSPDDYVIGPGDKLGLNIVANKNINFNITVTPTGDLLVPGVGVIYVGGLSVDFAEIKVKDYIQNNYYPSSEVSLVLQNLREFRVKVLGAVNIPGYAVITSVHRLHDVIEIAGGFHRDADEANILISRLGGKEIFCSLQYFYHKQVDSQNPIIQLGDIITIPYEKLNIKDSGFVITSKKNPINITGYLHKPGEYPYYFGYSVIDYINMAGGAMDNGSVSRVKLYRKGNYVVPQLYDYVQPGDQLYVPANFKYQLFGESSLIRTTTAILSLYLTFLAIQ